VAKLDLFSPLFVFFHFLLSSADVNNFCQGQSDGIFGDPSNCAYFIQCAGGTTFRETCAPGTAWDESIKTCNRMEAAHCDHSAR
jgi:hypothetical protein